MKFCIAVTASTVELVTRLPKIKGSVILKSGHKRFINAAAASNVKDTPNRTRYSEDNLIFNELWVVLVFNRYYGTG